MKRKFFILLLFMSIPLLIFGCSSDKPNKIGLVTDSKTDEQAITEVVTAYYEAIYNFTWDKYDKTKGIEFWTEEAGKELLNNPKKLPNLEKSIKENQITQKCTNIELTKITVQSMTANVETIVQGDSTSINPVFVGGLQSQEKIILNKINNQWFISERNAQIGIIQHE